MNAKDFSKDETIIWNDRKRIFGLPWTFTRYYLVESPNWVKIFTSVGLFYNHDEEVNLYRVDDFTVQRSFFDKIFGVGTIRLWCRDASNEYIDLIKVKDPFKVRDLITRYVDAERMKKRVGFSEIQF